MCFIGLAFLFPPNTANRIGIIPQSTCIMQYACEFSVVLCTHQFYTPTSVVFEAVRRFKLYNTLTPLHAPVLRVEIWISL